MWGPMLHAMNYKPKMWAAYSICCFIAIGGFVWYMTPRVKEESRVQKLVNITNDYPVLWLLYILVLGILAVFVLYVCFKPSSSPSQKMEELREAAERKKTDAETEEQPIIDEVDADDEEEDDEEKYSNPSNDWTEAYYSTSRPSLGL